MSSELKTTKEQILKEETIAVLSMMIGKQQPHAAVMHFAAIPNTEQIVFLTDRKYKKCQLLNDGQGSVRAAVVVGLSEERMKTVQLDGFIELTDDQALKDIYFEKYPDKAGKYDSPDDIFLCFTPTWWRITDWKTPFGKQSLDSEGDVVQY